MPRARRRLLRSSSGFYRTAEARSSQEWRSHSGRLRDFAVTHNGRRLATACVTPMWNYLIEIWNLRSILESL